MKKEEFLREIRVRMDDFSKEEIQKTLSYYGEILSDKIDGGMSEDEAVSSMDSPDFIVKELMLDLPIPTLIGTRLKPKSELNAWQIALMAVGGLIVFPILFSLMFAAFSIFVSIWMVIIAVYVTVCAFGFSAILSLVAMMGMIFNGAFLQGFFSLGVFFVLAGLTILLSLGVQTITKKLSEFSLKYVRAIKRILLRKGENHEK